MAVQLRHGYKVLIITVFADFINIFGTESEGDMCKVAQALHIFIMEKNKPATPPLHIARLSGQSL